MLTEILIVVVLIVLNGGLSMSELAFVSSRPARLRSIADAGSKRAAIALRLCEDPGKFLSSVQLGMTLVGVLSGAFSGATLGTRLSTWLVTQGVDPDWAHTFGVGGVVVVLTYLTLIIGELVPKQIALRNPEAIAMRAAPFMVWIARIASPLVWLLDWSGRMVLALLGVSRDSKARVTEEEVRTILAEAKYDGVIEDEEQEMLSGVMRLADRSARALMTPRRDVELIDLQGTPEETIAAIRASGRPRIPVRNRDTDEVVGVLYMTDAFAAISQGQPLDVGKLMREVPVVTDKADALAVIEILRASPNHMALVYDEHGSFEGIITTGDILEAITGTFQEHKEEEPAMFQRSDDTWLVAGWMPVDEFCERMALPRNMAGDYDTVAGLMLHQFHRLPDLGDSFIAEGHRFEVIDLDDRRIDKVLVTRL
jgi:putative hemolysin